MVIVQGKARFAPGVIDRHLEALQAMVAATREEEGCIAYSYAVDVSEPDTLRICELWRDQAALDHHFATPHMAALNAVMAEAKPLELAITAHDASDPRPLRL
jgi:quinol monooxygenase YgiN